MTRMRAVPALFAIAGLLAAGSSLAQVSNSNAPPYPGGPTADGRPNYGVVLSNSAYRREDGLTAGSDARYEANLYRAALQHADDAWARGDKKGACKWALDAQTHGGTSGTLADKIDRYCDDDSATTTDHS